MRQLKNQQRTKQSKSRNQVFMKTNSVEVFENHWLPFEGFKFSSALIQHTWYPLKVSVQEKKRKKSEHRS